MEESRRSQQATSEHWAFEEGRHLWMPYCQMKTSRAPMIVERTDGEEIVLADGRRLIDGIASWWTACHGYNHPHIVESITRQASKMSHVMFAGLVHEPAQRLSNRLAQMLPGDLNRIFLCDSGSVAVEVALKIAVQYWLNRGERSRHKFVCFKHSYHGDTTGAMSVCDPEDSMHAHFKGFLLEQFPAVIPESPEELNQFASFLDQRQSSIAGVIIEPLAQMAAGMRFHSPQTLSRIRQLCDAQGLLLIADEIATGFGRTGSMFACEQAGVVPDIMCLGKALTGGALTLAATAVRDHVYEPFHSCESNAALMHGPTYMANPLACAAANASLDLFETEPWLTSVRRIHKRFEQLVDQLRGMDGIAEPRSLGALMAVNIENEVKLDEVTAWFVERGIWLRPIHNVVYACPPFTITDESLSRLTDTILDFCAENSTSVA